VANLSEILQGQREIDPSEYKVSHGELWSSLGNALLGVYNMPGALIKSGLVGGLRGGFDQAINEMAKTSESGGHYTPELENPYADFALSWGVDPFAWIGGGSIPKMAKWVGRKVTSAVAPSAKVSGEEMGKWLAEKQIKASPTAKKPPVKEVQGPPKPPTVEEPHPGVLQTYLRGMEGAMGTEPIEQVAKTPRYVKTIKDTPRPGGGSLYGRELPEKLPMQGPPAPKGSEIAPEVLDVVEHLSKPTVKTGESFARGDVPSVELVDLMSNLVNRYNFKRTPMVKKIAGEADVVEDKAVEMFKGKYGKPTPKKGVERYVPWNEKELNAKKENELLKQLVKKRSGVGKDWTQLQEVNDRFLSSAENFHERGPKSLGAASRDRYGDFQAGDIESKLEKVNKGRRTYGKKDLSVEQFKKLEQSNVLVDRIDKIEDRLRTKIVDSKKEVELRKLLEKLNERNKAVMESIRWEE
jgi:hypothetical protein